MLVTLLVTTVVSILSIGIVIDLVVTVIASSFVASTGSFINTVKAYETAISLLVTFFRLIRSLRSYGAHLFH